MKAIKRLFFVPEDVPESLIWLQRRQTWAGDVKGNILRAAGLAAFGVNELVNYHLLHAVDKTFHLASLGVLAVWAMAAAGFWAALRKHWAPRSLPYVMAGADALLLTWLLTLADGPRSPLVAVYFLVIALAALRLNPGLVLFSMGICAYGYLSVCLYFHMQRPELAVAAPHTVIVLLCFLLMGLILAHALSRVFSLMAKAATEGAHGR